MNTNNNHTDDFKKLFDNAQMADLPMGLEDKILAGIEIQKISQARKAPHWFSTNLVLFCLSIFLLTIVGVFQYFTEISTGLLIDIRQMAMLSTSVFFILWIIETADEFLQLKLSSKFHSNFR